MVIAHADAVARVPFGAALADDDVAGNHALAAGLLDAEAPARWIAAVARGTTGFLMCHGSDPYFFLAGLAAGFFAGAFAAGFLASAAFFAGAAFLAAAGF